MNQEMLDLLYRSFDGHLSEEEQAKLQEALARSSELRQERTRLERMRQAVAESKEISFRPFFSARVLHRIRDEEKQTDFTESLVWMFKRVALVASLALILLVATNVLRGRGLSIDALLGMPQVTLEDSYQLDALPFEEAL